MPFPHKFIGLNCHQYLQLHATIRTILMFGLDNNQAENYKFQLTVNEGNFSFQTHQSPRLKHKLFPLTERNGSLVSILNHSKYLVHL